MDERQKNRILFKKPDLEDLSKKYNAVDMHFHSKYSDGINKIKSILAHAKKLNIGIAITDHNTVKGAIEACKQDEVLVIPGIEITSSEGPHILIYFYEVKDILDFNEKYLKPNLGRTIMFPTKLSIEQIIKIGKKYNCLVSFAHPYSFGTTGIYTKYISQDRKHKIIDNVDTFEVINSENFHVWNLMSGIKAYNLGKNMIGGSDGHTLYHMGKVVTYTEKYNSKNIIKQRKNFLDQIKANKSRVVGKDIDILRKFISTMYKIKPNIRKLPRATINFLAIKIPTILKIIR